jgi:lipopolysaccharide biosynthesis glycosyltransferase
MATMSHSQEIVSIAFCVDSNYIQHLTVTLYSICDNLAQDRALDLYTVYNSLTQTEQERLIADMATFTNVRVFFIHDTNDYNSLAIDSSMTQSTYLKFNLPNTLPQELTKVLYIDCDIIAQGDISELYDLSPKYLMAVRDTNIYLEKYYNFLF